MTPAMELVVFHLCYKTKWFPGEEVNSRASMVERFLAANKSLVLGMRYSTILGLWFQAVFFNAHQPALPQVRLNLQHNAQMGLDMTWFLGRWWPFDADSAKYVFLLAEIIEEHRFYALTSPLLCYEAMFGVLSCSVKHRSESNYFSRMLETCSPFQIPEVVCKPFTTRVLTFHHCPALQLFLPCQSSERCWREHFKHIFCWWKYSRGFVLIFKWRYTGSLGNNFT